MQIKSLSMLVLLLMILMLSLLSGARVKNLTSQCGLEQTINEPTPFKIKARSITI